MLPSVTLKGDRMKCTFLYDKNEPSATAVFNRLAERAQSQKVAVDSFDVSAETPSPCIGCFKCWIRTPGVCIYKKDIGNTLIASIITSDYMIVITRILWGGYSTPIKTYIDRILPLLHPFFKKYNSEMHHQLRYTHYPTLLAVGYDASSPEEETTFINYNAAVRDQTSHSTKCGVFIVNDVNVQLNECSAWLGKEIAA